MDRSAIQAIAELAVDAQRATVLDTDTPAVILRNNQGMQEIDSLELFQPGRSRYRGNYETRAIDAFASYVTTTHAASADVPAVFIDPEHMFATAFFNLGTLEHPGHGDHRAVLKLKPTAAYAALRQATTRALDQRSLHDFIEDWRDIIQPVYDQKPDATRLVSALAAVRDVTIETARKTNNVERDLGATRSTMESVDAKSTHTLPHGFIFSTTPYEGLGGVDFRLRLGVLTGGDKLAFALRIQQAEKVEEDIATDFHRRLQHRLVDHASLLIGTFTP
jgi:uncharacterized protein YfdQ (DUF2303 family)